MTSHQPCSQARSPSPLLTLRGKSLAAAGFVTTQSLGVKKSVWLKECKSVLIVGDKLCGFQMPM